MSQDQEINSQMALPLALDDKASFENFFSGDNHELVQALKASFSKDEQVIVFFYGISGSGKSHLMFALQRLAKQLNSVSCYLSLSDTRVSSEMLEIVDAQAMVCIDNIQAWAGDNDKERALFALFERVKRSRGSLLVNATHPPESCGFELKDLVSRLNSGLVYPLHSLNDNQCFEAIKLTANQRGLSITDDVVKYLLSRSSRDTKELFALLDQIDKASLIEQRRITIPFLQTLLKE